MPPKVSIVVPTYAPGDKLARVVASLDAQTLPADQFEVIFVDDGSPDDTWQRLEEIKRTRANVRITRIENSGWPSRPRNVGLEMATGDYVLFMDHDDELYPRALEAGSAMAERTGCDVLNGKETRTDQPKWAIEMYEHNADNVAERAEPHPLIPTNPHKLFRRAFLLEHGIRFPEGRRVLWEDVFFCLDVARHAKIISVLADTPFYHWVRGGETASSSYTANREEYWLGVAKIIEYTNSVLDGPERDAQRRSMLGHQYRTRILAPLADAFSDNAAADRTLWELLERTVAQIPSELDATLTAHQRGRAFLLRRGEWELLRELVGIDSGLTGISTAIDVAWKDAALVVTATSTWTTSNGTGPAIRREGDRLVRDLPAHLTDALPEEAKDVTSDVQAARTAIGIRARATAENWMLPGSCAVTTSGPDAAPTITVTATAVLDPATAIFGHPLDGRAWDFTARNELFGVVNQRKLRTSVPASGLVAGNHVYIAYRSNAGMLSLDVDQLNRSLSGTYPLDCDQVEVADVSTRTQRLLRRGLRRQVQIPFARSAATADAHIAIEVSAGKDAHRIPAEILGRGGQAWLRVTVTEPVARTRLWVHTTERSIDTGIDLEVDPRGVVSVTRAPR